MQCCTAAWLLGLAFDILKFGIEWREEFAEHLVRMLGIDLVKLGPDQVIVR